MRFISEDPKASTNASILKKYTVLTGYKLEKPCLVTKKIRPFSSLKANKYVIAWNKDMSKHMMGYLLMFVL